MAAVSPVPIQIPASAPGKAAEDGPRAWALATHPRGGLGQRVPGSRLEHGLVSTTATFGRINHRMEDLSPLFPNSATQTNKINIF